MAKSKTAQYNLLKPNSLPKNWDIIILQEPYIDPQHLTRATRAWNVIYPTSHLTDKDSSIRSVILVNEALDTNTWTQISLPGTNDITAVQLQGNFGRLSLFNIYNDCTHSRNIDILDNFLKANRRRICEKDDDYMIWAGDFNRHHPLWDEARNHHLFTRAAMDDAQLMLDLMVDYNMVMTLPKDIPTLQARNTKNWTRPDNIFCSSNAEDCVIRCDVIPELQGPTTDHLPIVTILDIRTAKKKPEPRRNFRMANWDNFNNELQRRLTERGFPDPKAITNVDAFQEQVLLLTAALQQMIDKIVPMTKFTPYTKRWWNKELEDMRKHVNQLSAIAHRYRAIENHESSITLDNAKKLYALEILRVKAEHWKEFLEDAMEDELWIANRYITNPTGDGGKTRIPTLKYKNDDGTISEAITNEEKSDLFARTLFPEPPHTSSVPADFAYPMPLPTSGEITEEQIRRNIAKLSPYKACGTDGIPNIVLNLLSRDVLPGVERNHHSHPQKTRKTGV